MGMELSAINRSVDAVTDVTKLRDFLDRLHKAWNDDPETAHGIEDTIKSHVLKLVADGHPDAQAIAREVLVMDDWDVERWYA